MMTDNKVNRVLDLLLMILWKRRRPDEWQNVVKEGKDGYLKFDYTTCVPILWSALQYTMNENEEMRDLFKAMRKEMATLKGEITKLKKKVKNNSDSEKKSCYI